MCKHHRQYKLLLLATFYDTLNLSICKPIFDQYPDTFIYQLKE